MLYDKKKYSLTCGGKEIALETCWVTICHALASHCVMSCAASPSDVVQPQNFTVPFHSIHHSLWPVTNLMKFWVHQISMWPVTCQNSLSALSTKALKTCYHINMKNRLHLTNDSVASSSRLMMVNFKWIQKHEFENLILFSNATTIINGLHHRWDPSWCTPVPAASSGHVNHGVSEVQAAYNPTKHIIYKTWAIFSYWSP